MMMVANKQKLNFKKPQTKVNNSASSN